MGSQTTKSYPISRQINPIQWNIKSRHKNQIVIRSHPSLGTELMEQQFEVPSQQQFFKIENLYRIREGHLYLVSTSCMAITQSKEYCGKSYKGSVFYQRLLTTLQKIRDIPFPDFLHFYSVAFKGFQILYQMFGYFQVLQEMFHINSIGKVKIWLDNDIRKLEPAVYLKDVSGTQEDMVSKVIYLIQSNTDACNQAIQLKQYFLIRPNGKSSFVNALASLRQFCRDRNLNIPERLSCLENVSYSEYAAIFDDYFINEQDINAIESNTNNQTIQIRAIPKNNFIVPQKRSMSLPSNKNSGNYGIINQKQIFQSNQFYHQDIRKIPMGSFPLVPQQPHIPQKIYHISGIPSPSSSVNPFPSQNQPIANHQSPKTRTNFQMRSSVVLERQTRQAIQPSQNKQLQNMKINRNYLVRNKSQNSGIHVSQKNVNTNVNSNSKSLQKVLNSQQSPKNIALNQQTRNISLQKHQNYYQQNQAKVQSIPERIAQAQSQPKIQSFAQRAPQIQHQPKIQSFPERIPQNPHYFISPVQNNSSVILYNQFQVQNQVNQRIHQHQQHFTFNQNSSNRFQNSTPFTQTFGKQYDKFNQQKSGEPNQRNQGSQLPNQLKKKAIVKSNFYHKSIDKENGEQKQKDYQKKDFQFQSKQKSLQIVNQNNQQNKNTGSFKNQPVQQQKRAYLNPFESITKKIQQKSDQKSGATTLTQQTKNNSLNANQIQKQQTPVQGLFESTQLKYDKSDGTYKYQSLWQKYLKEKEQTEKRRRQTQLLLEKHQTEDANSQHQRNLSKNSQTYVNDSKKFNSINTIQTIIIDTQSQNQNAGNMYLKSQNQQKSYSAFQKKKIQSPPKSEIKSTNSLLNPSSGKHKFFQIQLQDAYDYVKQSALQSNSHRGNAKRETQQGPLIDPKYENNLMPTPRKQLAKINQNMKEWTFERNSASQKQDIRNPKNQRFYQEVYKQDYSPRNTSILRSPKNSQTSQNNSFLPIQNTSISPKAQKAKNPGNSKADSYNLMSHLQNTSDVQSRFEITPRSVNNGFPNTITQLKSYQPEIDEDIMADLNRLREKRQRRF